MPFVERPRGYENKLNEGGEKEVFKKEEESS